MKKTNQKGRNYVSAIGKRLNRRLYEKPGLKNVSFTLEPNQIVGLIGLNGAGKARRSGILSD